ncbi:hypothetical protein BJAS_P2672 [Bathymodiolus japonicus methanotrophic gill symbiont]|uniref:hypothetical protein n=1 Tax=Bathymodiolus japonicus methanotrophic gill symbiont TaxID=113269 RepID=UPI001B44EA24|nr:hypothetical protein [Bathymodiolus japonicus methanotrophic gill symbiont]GFO72433.1 hypothetical protein BJAS_P2672 [Bathymodiolus japonicus methanotrophic gill symbiont]
MKYTILKVLIGLLFLMPHVSRAESKSCSIKYNLTGWSFFYQGYKGSGLVSCTNGQSAKVSLTLHGGGLTLGVIDIDNAKGKFTGIKSIKDIYGTYFSIDVHAGFSRSAEARTLFKGYIAGGGAGVGGGYNLGLTFSGLTIKP